MSFKDKFKNKKGQIIIYVLFYILIGVASFSALSGFLTVYVNSTYRDRDNIKIFNIAESGLEQARWYLNHYSNDFTNGTATSGPYSYKFYNRLGEEIGSYILEIQTPQQGINIVNLKTTAKLKSIFQNQKTLKMTLGKPSFTKYSVLVDDNIRFGSGTIVYGEIHSNRGIRFDGIAFNTIKSSLITYDDPDHTGCYEWAVHTHLSPQDPCPGSNPDPQNIPQRDDVFKAGRLVGVPGVNFNGISANLADLKTLAQQNGFYRGFSGNNYFGYEIVLKENNFDLYRVNSLTNPPSGCQMCDSVVFNPACSSVNTRYNQSTWSIANRQFLGTFNYPTNSVIFIEDNLWIRGKIQNKRLVIGSARFPEDPNSMTNIIINDNLLYTYYDNRDVIGLLAQKNIYVGLKSTNTLRIDAALIAKNGRIGRQYYSSSCGSEYLRNKITLFGTLSTRLRYGFTWSDSQGNTISGYNLRDIIYDNNLLYAPPPYFPLSTDFYQILKWERE
ncbi:MAG: hypothetical protein KatS3mg097_049 [Candidatus Parcubacteria bacterium]|nr:MAG: hypothetical protein KatS3mg097_049 [Candidatus Parcubacteria bacterium]